MLDHSSPFAGAEPPGPDAKHLTALRRLRHAALICEIAPGAEITEAEVAERYRIGRAGVRAALNVLAAEGFVLARPRKGWQVAPISGALIGDIIAARLRLEPALAEQRLGAKQAERLLSLSHINAELAQRDDAQAFLTARIADRQIMEALAEPAGGFLRRWLGQVWDHADRVAHFLAGAGFRFAASDREALIAALAAGEAEAARAELERDAARFRGFVADSLLRLPLPLDAGAGGRAARSRRARPGGAVTAARPQQAARQASLRRRS